MEHLYTLKGKAALITGSCRGIGRMIAQGLLGAGARVIISGRDETFTNTVATELAELGNCRAICGDLSSREGLDKLARDATAMEPGLNILINNAAIHLPDSLSENDPDQFTQVYRNNTTSTFELSRLLLPVLVTNSREMDPSRIVNISSSSALGHCAMGSWAYVSSKAAVQQITLMMASELTSRGINVNAIAPGMFATRMIDPWLDENGNIDISATGIPAGRMAQPEDIQGVVNMLCARAGAYISGAVIAVDGADSVRPLFPAEQIQF